MHRDFPVVEFGLGPVEKDSSARALLNGDKRATTSLFAAYAYDREPLPVVGRRGVVRDGRRREIAVIQTTRVETRRFCDVDASYAAIEGEGDKSLAHWRKLHWDYLGFECRRIGVPMSETVDVVLERFDVVEALMRREDF
jgi:uncharacterized protein YhfF